MMAQAEGKITDKNIDNLDNIENDENKGEALCILYYPEVDVSPQKKTLKVGKSFTLEIVPSEHYEKENYSDEEWKKYLEETIENVSFHSSKKSVASVNKITGKVKAKKKGTAIIKTTIDFLNGETITFKTKVYVKNR